ncbi:energy-coupling factor transporter transmembrane component T family protein [Aliarcobacter cibarius]|uniref:Cobalt/nickel ECF transporter CbiMNQO, T component CbiQ n=1 Tax=Aliarcobacter cibarius TaxID=255507 RepID=A0A5J6RFN2_9BACT|nr:energy-coupling factor transporter transmembrane component T [Aliarcobacter cibarius]QEZ89119.1 cobalt/nickel ECF transporter CbiMNQO, T component CbiQ [Aliarcobacter cibarius]QKJ27152.1 cobalt/nickel ECF transporter CbiMNQO, T component CbiQ [Aliarcobacter cibarius]TLS96652.1 energy-coupling factor transporter transmembrane protein EcfT [Aliarcobacter cibarius]TLS97235.1 energy-coupling factor transporter transmembrane protein EcfT [Aliarcobacter cibarius]TLT02590.1 energy-coupling factor 
MNLNPAIALSSAFIFSLLLSFSNLEVFYIVPIIFLIFLNLDNIFIILKKLIFLNFFILFLSVFFYFETNFMEALNLFLKVNMIILFNLLLFFSSNGFDIVKGFMILRFPKKFVSSLYFSVKLIFELNLELKNIRTSLKARNFKAKTDIFTYKTYGNIFGILFLKTITKSEQLKENFLLRGFKNEIFLSYSNEIKKFDFILIFILNFIFLLKVVL